VIFETAPPIVFFRDASGKPVLHRLMGFLRDETERFSRIKADVRLGPDPPVPVKNIFARVKRIYRIDSGGNLILKMDLSRPLGRFFNQFLYVAHLLVMNFRGFIRAG